MRILKSIHFGEALILLVGILFLFNVWYIAQTGEFTYWFAAKVAYAIGLVLFLFNR